MQRNTDEKKTPLASAGKMPVSRSGFSFFRQSVLQKEMTKALFQVSLGSDAILMLDFRLLSRADKFGADGFMETLKRLANRVEPPVFRKILKHLLFSQPLSFGENELHFCVLHQFGPAVLTTYLKAREDREDRIVIDANNAEESIAYQRGKIATESRLDLEALLQQTLKAAPKHLRHR